MANHCENYISIQPRLDDNECCPDYDKLVTLFKRASEDGDFELPMELAPLNEEKTYSTDDAYDHWGTKWFDVESYEDYDGYELRVYAVSAWAPATGLMVALADQFDVKISNSFNEPGACFYGHSDNFHGYTREFVFSTINEQVKATHFSNHADYVEKESEQRQANATMLLEEAFPRLNLFPNKEAA